MEGGVAAAVGMGLLCLGKCLYQVDNAQHSALYYASDAGYTEIVEQLLMAGADS